jgi:hypothetical protein
MADRSISSAGLEEAGKAGGEEAGIRESSKTDERRKSEDFSNGIWLTGRQWMGVGFFALAMILISPTLWKQYEKFDIEPDYRLPHDLSNDYWLYDRYSRLAADHYDTVLIGDSVIWGEYVTRQQTLAHYLNEQAGQERFANLGLDGAHPLALNGLVQHYAKGVAAKNVVLFCNLLWMSSPRADLQTKEPTDFSHPRLIPQFVPHIPCYHEEISPRIGVLVEQRVPFNSWANHLQQVYYDRTDIPSWTLEHPHDNPVKPLTRGLPPPDNSLRHDPPQPWFKRGITKQDYPWVELETSLQWHAFQEVVDVLQRRGNRLLVLVGPFNEHILSDENLPKYQELRSQIEKWLEEKGVAYVAPPALPGDLYADASHPLDHGYALLARQIRLPWPE